MRIEFAARAAEARGVSPAEHDDRRVHQRLELLGSCEVREAGNGERVGVLEDLSLGGFRLGTPRVIAVGVRKEFLLGLPAPLESGERELRVAAECRWLRAQARGPGFVCGFEFTADNPAELKAQVGQVLHALG